jgi:hypothetical protein
LHAQITMPANDKPMIKFIPISALPSVVSLTSVRTRGENGWPGTHYTRVFSNGQTETWTVWDKR